MGRIHVNNIDHLPTLGMDEFGFPKIPNPISKHRRDCLSEDERKVRFLVAYNVSGGVLGFACTDAGIRKPKYEEWMKDEKFLKVFKEVKEEITDRLQVLLNQRVGLVAPTEAFKNTKINDYVLLAAMKALRPDVFDSGASNGQGLRINLEIPRPEREERDNDLLQAASEASGIPQMQS